MCNRRAFLFSPKTTLKCFHQTATQFQSSWIESQHGFAITKAYAWGGFVRQDFQYTVMYLNSSTGDVIIDGTNPDGSTWIAPGMTEHGWDWAVSPYFVKVYNEAIANGVAGRAA